MVVCADAWTNEVLAHVGHEIPLTVTLEQATYFAPEDPSRFQPDRMPLWIWMDEPSFYGFPCYGEQTVKAAQDCGGPEVEPDARGDEVDPAMEGLLADHMARMLPGSGRPVRSLRCQYTLPPDRDFVLDRVPGHPAVVVGLGAGHGFKFAPTLGRLLADLATGDAGDDLADVRLRPARAHRPGVRRELARLTRLRRAFRSAGRALARHADRELRTVGDEEGQARPDPARESRPRQVMAPNVSSGSAPASSTPRVHSRVALAEQERHLFHRSLGVGSAVVVVLGAAPDKGGSGDDGPAHRDNDRAAACWAGRGREWAPNRCHWLRSWAQRRCSPAGPVPRQP